MLAKAMKEAWNVRDPHRGWSLEESANAATVENDAILVTLRYLEIRRAEKKVLGR